MDRRGFLASAGVAAAAVALPHDVRASEPSCDPVPVTRYGTDQASILRVLAESCDVMWPKVTAYPFCHVITETLPLRSYQTWWLEGGAILRWYAPAGTNARMIDTTGAQGARITGKGRIDGRRTYKTVGLHIGAGTQDLLVEHVTLDRFGNLDQWGVWGDGIYMTGGGPIGSATEPSNPRGVRVRDVTIRNCARNGFTWKRGHDIELDHVLFQNVGGLVGGQENTPGAGVDIEPTEPGATTPTYRIDGTLRDCSWDNCRFAVTYFGTNWTGPVKLEDPLFNHIRGQNYWPDPHPKVVVA